MKVSKGDRVKNSFMVDSTMSTNPKTAMDSTKKKAINTLNKIYQNQNY